jgi:hypothetical protein
MIAWEGRMDINKKYG